MKKLISLILALSMIIGMAAIASADEPSSWAKEEVESAVETGLVPDYLQANWTSPVTRGQVAEMFILLLEKATGKTVDAIIEEKGATIEEGKFEDTNDANVYAANALGIINGTSSTKFSPDGTLKRAQIAALINRVAKVVGINTNGFSHDFEDITDNYSWVDSELGWPYKSGIINGVSSSKFNPGGDLTTEQAILITYRAYKALKSSAVLNANPYQRVVIFGVDGAGAFFKDTDTPNIDRIFADGAITYNCITSTPSISAECWGALFHGVTPEQHGLTNASSVPYPMTSEYPSFFHVLRQADSECEMASFCHWNTINVAIVEYEEGLVKDTADSDEEITEKVIEYLDDHDPRLLFVHFDDVDSAGHSYGFGSETHLKQISTADALIGKIYDKLESKGVLDDTLVIVTPDHGGTIEYDENGNITSGSHGGDTYEEMNIMVAIRGKTVKKGQIGEMAIRDIASIVTYAFGLEQPEHWTSRVPSGVFEGVEATARRDYIPEVNVRYGNEGEDTPLPDSGKYITDFFDESVLASYITLDDTVKDDLGKIRTTPKNKLYFIEGYRGTGAKMVDGHFISQFMPGNSSFTISFWLNAPSNGGNPLVFSNQDWYNMESQGFSVAIDDGKLQFNLGDGTTYDNHYFPLPDNYRNGWVHVDLIVDRDAGTVSICYDFSETETISLPDSMKDISFNGKIRGIVFGEDGSASYYLRLPATLDDIIIFNKALTNEDIATLAEYYGIEK